MRTQGATSPRCHAATALDRIGLACKDRRDGKFTAEEAVRAVMDALSDEGFLMKPIWTHLSGKTHDF